MPSRRAYTACMQASGVRVQQKAVDIRKIGVLLSPQLAEAAGAQRQVAQAMRGSDSAALSAARGAR